MEALFPLIQHVPPSQERELRRVIRVSQLYTHLRTGGVKPTQQKPAHIARNVIRFCIRANGNGKCERKGKSVYTHDACERRKKGEM